MIVCLNCGKLNPEGFNYCLECGAELQPDQSQSVESNFLIGLNSESEEMDELRKEADNVDAEAAKAEVPHQEVSLELEPDVDSAKQDVHNMPTQEIELEEVAEEQPSIELEPIDDEEEQAPPVQKTISTNDAPQAAPQASGETKICLNCGATMGVNDRFCGNCGAPFGQKMEPKQEGKTMFMAPPETHTIEKPVGRLIALDPTGAEGMIYNMSERTIVGRTEGDIVLDDDPYISPVHCAFNFSNGYFYVEDLGSLNGVFMRINEAVALRSWQTFRIGQQLLMYVAPEDFETLPEAHSEDGTVFWGAPRDHIWGKLVRITNEGTAAEQYPLIGQFVTIGRERGDILFSTDGFVSGTHARVANENGRVVLSDLNSSNGTYIRVGDDTPIGNSSILLIGRRLFRLEL